MILALSVKFRRPVAFFLWFIFYLQIIGPLQSLGAAVPLRLKYPGEMPAAGRPFKATMRPVKPTTRMPLTGSVARHTIKPVAPVKLVKPTNAALAEGGPASPEATTFKAAGADNLVNLFTGDFSYSIPLLDIDGYPVNLFYNGGITMDQEASWVGLGWNINPGSVSRNMRGIPDDFDGTDTLIQEENVKPNKTWGGEVSVGGELFGWKEPELNFSLGFSYNNYLGPDLDLGAGVSLNYPIVQSVVHDQSAPLDSVQGLSLGLGLQAKLSSRSGLTLAPSLNANLHLVHQHLDLGVGLTTSYNSRTGIQSLTVLSQDKWNFAHYASYNNDAQNKRVMTTSASLGIGDRMSSNINFAKPSYMPLLRMPMQYSNTAGQLEFGFGDIGAAITLGAQGYYSESHIAQTTINKPLVGYMYLENAAGHPDAVMDFNRLNDGPVTPNTPIISTPEYDYDVFAIQGEGTGGSIRAYRSDLGIMRDNKTTSTDKSLSIGLDIAPIGHYGGNVNTVSSPTKSGGWDDANNTLNQTLAFKGPQPGSSFENVYFRNPGELTVTNDNMINKVGRDNLVRFLVDGSTVTPRLESQLEQFSKSTGQPLGNLSVATANGNEPRDKRIQVVTMLNASDAGAVGHETAIRSYLTTLDANNNLQYTSIPRVGGYRKGHHISEIDVLESSGMRYVYGIPVYNTVQKDYAFTVGKPGDPTTNLTTYTPTNEPTTGSTYVNNNTAYDGYVNMQQTPAYASSFLLTELLSPDYVDVTGNGVSEDDLGRAVKFNYTMSSATHHWRTPRSSTSSATATFNAGLYSEKKDDKAIISYGEREAWYLNSIESKSMIAIFKTSPRSDAQGVVSDLNGTTNGGENANMKLDSIMLYTKADLKAYGLAGAVPIKTVHFDYSYTLCPGTPDNAAGSGKLTLNDIYFTFNGQARASKDMYVFNYGTNNPAYAYNVSDRWGTYKDPSSNPSGMTNIDYPYTSTNKTLDDQYAAAWALQKVLLPSGGQLEVQYESDDYAYVQNRRACNMYSIYGFGNSPDFTQFPMMYTVYGNQDQDYVYIQLPTPLQNSDPTLAKQEIFNKYLQSLNQFAFKLFVDMPKGPEPLTVYAGLDDYGVCPNSSNHQVIYLKLTRVNGEGALASAAIHFLIESLPGQAFPGYDLSDGTGLSDFFNIIVSELSGIKNAFTNADKQMRSDGKASTVTLAKSFVRLASPTLFKYGGGHRVKRVLLKDNWNALTGQYTSQYGQDYDYTTTADVNGVPTTISSGVASYEPGIGSEENPFREALAFEDKLPLASAQYGAIEVPAAEGLFQAPLVGYSQVTVRSIHRNGTHGDSVVRSAIGSQVTQFYTAKDYPTFFAYTPMNNLDYHKDPFFTFLNKQTIDRRTTSQGFLVETNDMHGKMKLQAVYSESDPHTPISYTRYTYKNTGANGLNDLVNFVHHDQSGAVTTGNIGVDVELMTDAREYSVTSNSTDYQGQVDFLTFVPFPIFVITIWPLSTYTENLYRAVTTAKLINFHAVQDSVIVNDKGSTITTKTLAYDSETGLPIVSQTANEFNDPVYDISLPAYWSYSGMGPAYQNIGRTFTGVTFSDGRITGGISDMSVFESGDELYVTSQSGTSTCPVNSATATRLWVFDLQKNKNDLTIPSANRQLLFMDASGNLYTMPNVSFTILRSGHRNDIEAFVGKLTAMQNPIQTVGSTKQLVLGNSDNVVNATASDFREKWQVDNDVILHKVYYTPACTYVQLDSINCAGILEKHINPYVKGLMGNFKTYRDYVYYGSRNETNPAVNTAIRHNGYINNFTSYWGFDVNSNLVPNTSSTLWVWKKELTKVNAKGQELETVDPLGRYTEAQYGYFRDRPVAVTQNSRLGYSFYDGFEDYSYNESIDSAFVNPCAQRYVDFSGLGGKIVQDSVNNWAHTGAYKLAVNPNSSVARSIPVSATPLDSFNFIVNPDATKVLNNPGGSITGIISNIWSNSSNPSGSRYGVIYQNLGLVVETNLQDSCNSSGVCRQPNWEMDLSQYTNITVGGTYNFALTETLGTYPEGYHPFYYLTVTINREDGSNVASFPMSGSSGGTTTNNPVYLCPGIYQIQTDIQETDPYSAGAGAGNGVDLSYTVTGPGSATSYATLSTQNGCPFTDPIAATDSMLNPLFTLVPGQHMQFSAWVREATDTACCIAGYANDQVQLQFPGSNLTPSVTLLPSGPVIEGWQKVEGDFVVPADATSANLVLSNKGSSGLVYFDDLRIHPFNADMQSFVYDPQSLRLTSVLDENNYATFYDYDQEGQLVRVKKETAQGIKTVNETRVAKQKLISTVQ